MSSVLHIPSKSESIRCPNKNFALINSKPSVCWVIEAAIASNQFDRIVVSATDGSGRFIVDPYPVEVVIQTPSTVIGTTHDVLNSDDYLGRITIMLPTACLITPDHITQAVQLSNDDPVIVVTRFPFRTREILEYKRGRVTCPFLYHHDLPRGDDWEGRLFIDAGCLYTFPPGQFRDVESMYTRNLRPFVIPRHEGVDVDQPEDLEMVRRLARCQ